MKKNHLKNGRMVMLSWLMLMFCSMSGFAQVLNGKVTDTQDDPLPGVTVMLKGSSTVGTITDINGMYTLKVNNLKSDVIVVSFIGMETQEIAVMVGQQLI